MIQLEKLESLQKELKEIKQTIGKVVGDKLNERGVGNTGFYTRRQETMIQTMETNLKTHTTETIQQCRIDKDNMMQNIEKTMTNYDVVEEVETNWRKMEDDKIEGAVETLQLLQPLNETLRYLT